MSEHAINVVTRWVVIGPLLLWLAWELVLIVLRERYGMNVRLISQEARSLAYRGFPSLAYFLGGLVVHFFLNWRCPTWDGPAASVLGFTFWAIGAAYLVADWLDPERAYWPIATQYLRHPRYAVIIGGFTAFLAFPQRSLWEPGAVR
jgi:hypothetical protein